MLPGKPLTHFYCLKAIVAGLIVVFLGSCAVIVKKYQPGKPFRKILKRREKAVGIESEGTARRQHPGKKTGETFLAGTEKPACLR
jgi:hypothetical protein